MGQCEVTEIQRKYLAAASRAVLRHPVNRGDTVTPHDLMHRRTSDRSAITPDMAERMLPAVAVRSLLAGEALRESDCRPPKTVAVVPCRMKSTRLKQKAILPIHGIPSIQRCLINGKAIQRIDCVVLATSTNAEDVILESHALAVGAEFLRGSAEDVLERFLVAARIYEADFLLRITGDCPVVSFEIANMLVDAHLSAKADVTYCLQPFAIGTASEVYSVSALQRLRQLVPRTDYSEYMLLYFTNNPSHFKLNPVQLPETYRHSEWRLTLDEQADLDLFNLMFAELNIGAQPLAFEQIAGFFARNPEASRINAEITLPYLDDPPIVRTLHDMTTIRCNGTLPLQQH